MAARVSTGKAELKCRESGTQRVKSSGSYASYDPSSPASLSYMYTMLAMGCERVERRDVRSGRKCDGGYAIRVCFPSTYRQINRLFMMHKMQ